MINKELILKQVNAVRITGIANMFDKDKVIELAGIMEYSELVSYIENNPKSYFNLILTGEVLED